MKLDKIERLEYDIKPETGCFICTSHHISKKYASPAISINGIPEKIPRYVYKKYKGDIPVGYVIRHTCDNPMCINPDHLISGTHSDNVTDRVTRQRSACGESNGRRKLTTQDVIKIYFSQQNAATLCKIYNVNDRIIRGIWYKTLWKTTTKDFLPMWHINRNYYKYHKINKHKHPQ